MRRNSLFMVLAAVALVLSFAGGAVGAAYITGAQVKDGSLTGKDVKNHSLTPADFRGSVQGPAGAQGPAGPAGPAGPTGPQGPAGPSAVNALNAVTGEITVAAGGVDGGTLSCPSGQRVVSGGFSDDAGVIFMSHPNGDRTGWVVALDNGGNTSSATLDAYAFCAPSGQAVAARAHPRAARFVRASGRLRALIDRRR